MLIKAMILLLVAALGGLFLIKGPDGQPILSLSDLKPDVELPEQSSGPTTVYKWQDENGVWQFSNEPQPGQANVETLELDGQINTIPAVQVKTAGGAPAAEKSTAMSLPGGLTTVSPEKVDEMMQTVEGLQEAVNARKDDIDQLTGGKN